MNNRKLDFRKLYRLLFCANLLLFITLFAITLVFPQSFSTFGRTPPVCNVQTDFTTSLMQYWAFNIIPMCIVFILGLTFYIPALSLVISAFNGIYLALDICSYFDTYGFFFAGTMSFIALCISWIYLWYVSYVSCNSVKLYMSDSPFFKNISFAFTGKYIVWFALFSVMILLMNLAQCIMYRI